MQRHADEPFAVLGVNTDQDKEEYRRQAKEYGVTWRSAWQGSTTGPITAMWGVNAYPTIHVIDAEGRLRAVGVRGDAVDRMVERLLGDMKRKEESTEEAREEPAGGGGQGGAPELRAGEAAEELRRAVPAAAPVEDLSRRYEAALKDWQEALASAEPAEREAVFSRHPVAEFEAAFEALAGAGDGPAVLWLIKNLGQRPSAPEAATARRLELLEELVEKHASAEWLDGLEFAVADLWFQTTLRPAGERNSADPARLLQTAHAFLHATTNEQAERKVAFRLGWALAMQPRDAADEAAGAELFEYVIEGWPEDELAERSRGRLFRLHHLREGMGVPELVGETVDGEEVRLSSTRGKVVVVDFWGFW